MLMPPYPMYPPYMVISVLSWILPLHLTHALYLIVKAPMPMPMPQRPAIREADVARLCEMFPSLGRDVVESVLQANNGNVEAAVTQLLAM